MSKVFADYWRLAEKTVGEILSGGEGAADKRRGGDGEEMKKRTEVTVLSPQPHYSPSHTTPRRNKNRAK